MLVCRTFSVLCWRRLIIPKLKIPIKSIVKVFGSFTVVLLNRTLLNKTSTLRSR